MYFELVIGWGLGVTLLSPGDSRSRSTNFSRRSRKMVRFLIGPIRYTWHAYANIKSNINSAIYMATFLGRFPESVTKFNALQFSQEGSSA
jgi:hypothetical protein